MSRIKGKSKGNLNTLDGSMSPAGMEVVNAYRSLVYLRKAAGKAPAAAIDYLENFIQQRERQIAETVFNALKRGDATLFQDLAKRVNAGPLGRGVDEVGDAVRQCWELLQLGAYKPDRPFPDPEFRITIITLLELVQERFPGREINPAWFRRKAKEADVRLVAAGRPRKS